jgi:AraC-like DNA-binding protein
MAAMLAGESAGDPINESVTGRPAPGLRPFIDRYVGYRQAGVGPARHRGLPSPYLTVIFTLDDPLTVAEHADPRQPGGDYLTLVGGLHAVPALITHQGWQSGVQLMLSPLGARALLGLPAGELAGIDVEGTDLLGPVAAQIQQRIQSAWTWPERFAVLDETLLRRLACDGLRLADGVGAGHLGVQREVSPEIGYAWQRLLSAGGTVPVSALAAETGWSDRHLRARFAVEIGLTPKSAARIVRFDRAKLLIRQRAAAGQRLDLAGLAARCGYYDQAHLDAEFRLIAGCPPTTWLAQEFRNLQAREPAAGRG